MAYVKYHVPEEMSTAIHMGQLSTSVFYNQSCKGHGIWCCAFSPDDSYFAWSIGYGSVTIIPWEKNKPALMKHFRTVAALKKAEKSTEFSQDCLKHIFGPGVITIHTSNVVRSLAFSYYNPCDNYQQSLPFWKRLNSSNSLILATGQCSGRIKIWDVLTGRLILELIDHADLVTNLSFCPKGRPLLVSASCDGTLKVWNLQDDGNMCHTLQMFKKPVFSCSWSPDTTSLVSSGMSKIVYVWDMTNYSLRLQLKGHQHDVVSCAFSPDGYLIATASWDTRVILWEAQHGWILRVFCHLQPSPQPIFASGDNGTWIREVKFSPDGFHLATVADDGYLRFWDIECEETPEALAVIDDVLCCTYSSSGRVIAVGNQDGVISLWHSANCVKSLMFLARAAVCRQFPSYSLEKLQLPKTIVKYLQYNTLD